MSRQRDRDQFIAAVTREGIPLDVAQKLLAAEKMLHRLAELKCNSEAADRDRVPCPNWREPNCLCFEYGSHPGSDGDPSTDDHGHGDVPRIAVQGARLEARVRKLLAPLNVTPVFNGDPRGSAILLKVPSGRTTDWGQRGIAVPS